MFVAPYDDPLTVAGQGTIGTEILRQVRGNPHLLSLAWTLLVPARVLH